MPDSLMIKCESGLIGKMTKMTLGSGEIKSKGSSDSSVNYCCGNKSGSNNCMMGQVRCFFCFAFKDLAVCKAHPKSKNTSAK